LIYSKISSNRPINKIGAKSQMINDNSKRKNNLEQTQSIKKIKILMTEKQKISIANSIKTLEMQHTNSYRMQVLLEITNLNAT
jgi:hypothetical protein